MKRSSELRRSGFKKASYQRKPRQPLEPISPEISARFKAVPVAQEVTAAPKSRPVRDEKYRRLVASLPCACCGIHGYSQAAHTNSGKGMSIKADDMLCFPLCSDRPGVRGCHSLFDQGAMFTKEIRKQKEIEWIRAAQAVLCETGGLYGVV